MDSNVNDTAMPREGALVAPPVADRPARGRLIRRLWHNERGAAFIEFALILAPLVMLIFAIFEVGFVFWGVYDLENATDDAARQIRTGQVYAGNIDEAGFKAIVCANASVLFSCEDKLKVDVRSADAFGQLAPPSPLDGSGNLQTTFTYRPGGPGNAVLVTAFYEWPLINAISGVCLANMASGNRLLRASVAFRNEPFPVE